MAAEVPVKVNEYVGISGSAALKTALATTVERPVKPNKTWRYVWQAGQPGDALQLLEGGVADARMLKQRELWRSPSCRVGLASCLRPSEKLSSEKRMRNLPFAHRPTSTGHRAVAKDSLRRGFAARYDRVRRIWRAVNGMAQEDELDARQDQGVGRTPEQDFVLNTTVDEGFGRRSA
ncbi:hypothetical protein PHYSODRAFT_333676 [Phytophthora sojae]|uniref:Uncharacterized protein n=1 Tax=Phytophthora sojae (strain P6497) TaxID=1094619 RepID=G4ZNV9_PHYSP|nr:hypothetical protein PHYSODRAFT_333676 [Phytophthora sojae]EGZ15427.1 hypothetical protein PHYSODRAFT_333676 [Phytophthora sojae]|eukprot:XP_009529176.1 hypothetical protein PHYSODRAFT_333676 [Phytophthora sojae]